jgi:hypothetical protein
MKDANITSSQKHKQKMKKQLYIIATGLALLGSVTGFSQSEKKIIPCGTYEAMEGLFKANPESRKIYDANEAAFNRLSEQNKKSLARPSAVQYTIPVVFHILHQGGSENITDQAVIDAVKWVNDDLAKANSDASLTAAPFSSLYINSDIKLMLAKRDPNGNCTNGIIRHIDAKKDWSQSAANSFSYWSYTWPSSKYLNVYIVQQIVPQGTVSGGGIIVGYTYKPTSHGGANEANDAIVYRHDFLSGGDARSLTHELGHWLNLSHTWGDTNNPGQACGDDGCTDTPITRGQFATCPTSTVNTCAGSGGIDNVQNIMNYASCPINFTTDQTNRMRTSLSGTIAGRNNLITTSNHTFTGINNTVTCAPVSAFLSTSNSYTICKGGNITMKSTPYNGTVTTYAWSADNGATIVSPSNYQTSINFPTAGTSVVSLTVSNSIGSSASTQTVTVIDNSVTVADDYFQSFESPETYTANWIVTNPSGIAWEETGNAASHGVKSFYINGPGNQAGEVDYLQMPFIKPTLGSALRFKYAYARNSPTHNDKLEVQGSVNCGGSWFTIQSFNAATLANGSGGESSSPFFPSPEHWKTQTITNDNSNFFTLKAYTSGLIRFMFQENPAAGFGNYFYLDEIYFGDTLALGMNELAKSISFGLVPNPSNGEVTVNFSLQDQANIKLEVLDVVGRRVVPAAEFNFGPGEQSIPVNKNGTLSKGIYFVNMSYNGTKLSRKLIIE